jgi:hypothetical protein
MNAANDQISDKTTPPSKRGMRWWIPALTIAATANIIRLQTMPQLDVLPKRFWSLLSAFATVPFLLMWWLFLPRLRWRMRLLGVALVAFRPRLPAQALADLGQVTALGVVQAETPFDLLPENAVFLRQIFVSGKEFLVNRTRDIGRQTFPIHGPKSISDHPSDQGLHHVRNRCEPID